MWKRTDNIYGREFIEAVQTNRRRRRWIITGLILLPFLTCVGGGTTCAVKGCAPGYSDGERAGQVIKFSRKGIKFKSWEGTLNLGGVATDANGVVVPNAFEFSVIDPIVVEKVQDAQRTGRRVSLVYRQWWAKPMTQDTQYTVVDVK